MPDWALFAGVYPGEDQILVMLRDRKFFYVTLARVPGAKAHCSQVAQMSRAFLQDGWQFELLHPRRADLPAYRGKTIEQWYGFEQSIPVREFDCIDFMGRLPRLSPRFVRSRAFALLGSSFDRSLKSFLDQYPDPFFIYSRDLLVMSRLIEHYRRVPRFLELHKLTESPGSMWQLEKDVCARVNAIVVVTHGMKEMLVQRGIAADRILVEPNGIDTAAFPGTADAAESRQMLDLPDSARIVSFVGNFTAVGVGRGLDTVVSAIPRVVERYPNVLFLFVGGPLEQAKPLMARLKASRVPEDSYRFVDRRPYTELHQWLAASDILLHPIPRHEIYSRITSPLKVFEYMTASRPIIVSDLPSTRELLSDGDSALMVPPGDPFALVAAIERLLCDTALAVKLARGARRRVEGRTWKARAHRIGEWIAQQV